MAILEAAATIATSIMWFRKREVARADANNGRRTHVRGIGGTPDLDLEDHPPTLRTPGYARVRGKGPFGWFMDLSATRRHKIGAGWEFEHVDDN